MNGNEIKEALIKLNIAPKTVLYNNEKRILLQFDFNEKLNTAVKSLEGRKWSKTLNGWHIAADKKLLEGLIRALGPIDTQDSDLTNDLVDYLEKYSDKIKLKGYSYNTLKSYRYHFQSFLNVALKKTNIDLLTKDDLEKYLRWRQKKKFYSHSDQNLHINAIKFYYEVVLGRHRMLFDLPRPK
ncbi:MAG: phage integrase N-terminal SAM-like domain-containing protein, partial [Chitinophagales bacterium]|nr:phage integrase N-terminal SAM-like domain-containing protein [Chitinophagales bacterium]